MTRWYFKSIYTLVPIVLLFGCQMKPDTNASSHTQPELTLEDMAINVGLEENRPVSYTNKRSAYYYTQTHHNDHPEHTWFAGLNISQTKLFADYQITVGANVLDRKTANVTVLPHQLNRQYATGITETFAMFDNQDVLKIGLAGINAPVALTLLGDSLSKVEHHQQFDLYRSGAHLIAVTPINRNSQRLANNQFDATANGFYVIVSKDQQQLAETVIALDNQADAWLAQRKERMQSMLSGHSKMLSNDDKLNLAMAWITLNMDQLMTQQRGYGIYAGLPWFNEYWGRDNFIALPGASLVTGQFEWARNIITSFAAFQDTNRQSQFYGRVPNILKVGEIDYHTTDGTPRLIIEMMHYVKYTGDQTLAEQLFPVVERSIEGALMNWVDHNGYMTHKDNETWMDAREVGTLRAYSPRATRANDIQALWHQQLLAGVYFANVVGSNERAIKWQAIADELKANFNRDFVDSKHTWLADRLTGDDIADWQIRPNQLYAFDLVQNEPMKLQATKTAWQHLVYPWGVASLSNDDPQFHPYHIAWQSYHKDQAYHNGTIWLWNNGMAMQRMIEAGQIDLAYELFKNINMFALERGVVGGLAENSNAYPKPDQTWPTLTGTYLQAWSNAEHLRVWYQYFVGFRPDLINGSLLIAPRLPTEITTLQANIAVGTGSIDTDLAEQGNARQFHYRFNDVALTVQFDFADLETTDIDVQSGDDVTIQFHSQGATLFHLRNGATTEVSLPFSSEKQLKNAEARETMQGVRFAIPKPLTNHPVVASPN